MKAWHRRLAILSIVAAAWPMAAIAEGPCLPAGGAAPAAWTTPFPAHRVIGNLYAVGTVDLGVFLVTTPAGHILVNTGLADSTALIRENIARLGFALEDVRVLLTMQAHFDHTAALAEIKELTGAEMWATEKDARVLADGGVSDPQYGACTDFRFRPVPVDRTLRDGEVLEFGGMRITTHLHPGHTEGSASYSFTHRANGRDYRVLLANMGSVNEGKKLLKDPTYPGVAEDFATTFFRQMAMQVDVWVAAHGSQYGLQEKFRPAQPYDPAAFVDPEGFLAAVTKFEQLYRAQLAAEGG
jgi:metallo-beta-lactamase class B